MATNNLNGEELRIQRNMKSIKRAQQKELLFIFYYLWVALEFVVRLEHLIRVSDEWETFTAMRKAAWSDVSLHQEQYRRRKFSFWHERRSGYEWLKYLHW